MDLRSLVILFICSIMFTTGTSLASEPVSAEPQIDPRSTAKYSQISKIDRAINPAQEIETNKVWQALDTAMQNYLQDMHYCGHQSNQEYHNELLGKDWVIYASSHINPRMRRLCKVSVHTLHEASEISHDDIYATKYLSDYDLDYYMDPSNERIIGMTRDSQLGFVEVLETYTAEGFRTKVQIDSECTSKYEKFDGHGWLETKSKHQELSRKLDEYLIDVIIAGKAETVARPEDHYSISHYQQEQKELEIKQDQIMEARLIYPAEANKHVQFEVGPYQWFNQNYIPHEDNSDQVIQYSEEDFSLINSFYGASHFIKTNPCSPNFKNLKQKLDTLLN